QRDKEDVAAHDVREAAIEPYSNRHLERGGLETLLHQFLAQQPVLMQHEVPGSRVACVDRRPEIAVERALALFQQGRGFGRVTRAETARMDRDHARNVART